MSSVAGEVSRHLPSIVDVSSRLRNSTTGRGHGTEVDDEILGSYREHCRSEESEQARGEEILCFHRFVVLSFFPLVPKVVWELRWELKTARSSVKLVFMAVAKLY